MTDINITFQDFDPQQTQEWVDSLQAVLEQDGPERAQFLLERLAEAASLQGVQGVTSYSGTTPYINTIPVTQEPTFPGDEAMERRIRSLLRWNALAMVIRAGRIAPELGGHIASYASASVLYETGFNHFFRAATEADGGDLLYIQGHSSPGIYARSFLEGRFTEKDLNEFRQEVDAPGLSSYPHPWLMPEYWQFPTVSMGLGALQAIYQARFMKYMENRGLGKNMSKRKVWCFCGDGEMDEPESMGALTLARREGLDNLIFVINCNLQRLDGPVRGNGKVIQEFEGAFRGAGWHVIKVVWGREWDKLLANDTDGLLQLRMLEAVDGEYQNFTARDGAYSREKFFGKYPELAERVGHLTDEQLKALALNRGGHDVRKVYAAYLAATQHTGEPVVILAKTVKGYGMGSAGEALNITHQQKKLDETALRAFRDRFDVPIPDDKIADCPFYLPAPDSPEIQYLQARRKELGGYLPARKVVHEKLPIPALSAFESLLKDTGDREISTTMAFVRLLGILTKDPEIGSRIVPIVPDEARTFGMEGMFRQLGIYAPHGQLYEPVDSDQVMYYHETADGQILEEGITEAGAFSSWIAAGTSYAIHQHTMMPFYIYYSMFGFQRIADLAWAAGDAQARGFLLGATAGRTTLAGEGLQHQDGQSHLYSATIPNCISYDPTFAYELAVIMQDGMRRMFHENENVFYYLTVMNENYSHPAMPVGAEAGILKGLYLFRETKLVKEKLFVQLIGSGAIFREVIAAAEILEAEYGVASQIWSATSFTELRREGLSIERWNRLHPLEEAKVPYVTQCLAQHQGPIIAATDYMRIFADQIRQFIPNPYVVLGTDGYGRSDTRKQLRHFFEVDAKFIVVTTLKALADEGKLPQTVVVEAMKKLNVDPDKVDPVTV